jgi:hypothetical protein
VFNAIIDALAELIAAVKAGGVSCRTFARRMVGLGLTAPFVAQLLAHAGLAQPPTPAELGRPEQAAVERFGTTRARRV